MTQIDAASWIGRCDVVFLVLDALRYDVARDQLAAGATPNLARVLPAGRWEERHAPGNFTYASHQAFFAGFLPTPLTPGPHPRLFAARFPGSETTTPRTCVFDAPNLVAGLADLGYHTVCVGGVGFFNQLSPLGSVLPDLFQERHWDERLGVTDPASTRHQVALATRILDLRDPAQRVFLFVNVSAIHQPNRHYVKGKDRDDLESHAAALAYVDSQLGPLFAALERRGPTLCVLTSDHGTAYGEDGCVGHRHNHPVVTTVPYAEFMLGADA